MLFASFLESLLMMASRLAARLSAALVAFIAVACQALTACGAFPTAVNSPITDAVTQANVKVLGDAPAVAMGSLYASVSQALANSALNAANTQVNSLVTAQAATTQGVSLLYSIDTASGLQAGMKNLLASPLTAGSAAANVTIPPEGFLAGAALWAFDTDGVPGEEPDFWVAVDEGFDFFRGSNGSLILEPVRIRTFGDFQSPIVDATIAIPAAAVDEFFPEIFDAPSSLVGTENLAPSGDDIPAGAELPPFDYYFGVKDANGDFGYFAAYLSAVPEPATIGLAPLVLMALCAARRRYRRECADA